LAAPVTVLYVGRLSPRKGPDVAIEAIARLRRQGMDVRLDLVGAVFPGYEWFQTKLESRVATLGLSDVVTFHGFRPDRWPYTEASDIVIVPSTVDEPFGNTAVEAMLAARPLVVTDLGGLKEAAAGFAAVVRVQPDEVAALADGIAQVAGEWDTYRDLAIDDATLAAERFSAETYATSISRIVADAMHKGIATADRTELPAGCTAEHDQPVAHARSIKDA
jgi:glycosyltransferase involved in cell wall biosynthesis